MSDEELDADKQDTAIDTTVPATKPLWIRNKIPLIVMDGNHGNEYTAVTESEPELGDDGVWYVDVKYDVSCVRAQVETSKCIEIKLEETGRARLRKRKTPVIHKPRHHKFKIEKKLKKSGRNKVGKPPRKPPSIIDLTSGNDSDMESLGSFSFSEAQDLCKTTSDENEPLSAVARMPSREELRDDDDSEDFLRDDFHPVTPPSPYTSKAQSQVLNELVASDEDSFMNKKPAARDTLNPRRKKSRSSSVTQVSTITDESKKSTARSTSRKRREAEEKKKERDQKKFQAAKDALSNLAFSPQEIKYALEEIGPPYNKLQAAVFHMQRRRKECKTQEQLELFEVEIGMTIKKPFHGTLYEGMVLREVDEEVKKNNGNGGKVWEVAYKDGDQEELEYDELLLWRWPPPEPSPHLGRPMQALELFCGRGVVSQEFRQRLWKVISLDIDECSNATLVADIMKIEPKDLAFVPDFIWASLPCHTYSRLAGSYHRSAKNGEFETSDQACVNNLWFLQMVKIMNWAKRLHPHMIVAIENPVGQLADMPAMKKFEKEFGLQKVQVDYCAFGRGELKPTYIWTNDRALVGNLVHFRCKDLCCMGGMGRHDSVQATRATIDYGVIPQPLAAEVAAHVDSKFNQAGLRWTEARKPTDDA